MRSVRTYIRSGLAATALAVAFAFALVPMAMANETAPDVIRNVDVVADSTTASQDGATEITASQDKMSPTVGPKEPEDLQQTPPRDVDEALDKQPASESNREDEVTPKDDGASSDVPEAERPAAPAEDAATPEPPVVEQQQGTVVVPEKSEQLSTVVVPEESEQLKSQEEDDAAYAETHANMYRVYNPHSGEHLYTADLNEAYVLSGRGWRWEGIGWVVPTSSQNPVYRLYNPYSGDHHYTLDANEYNTLPGYGWRQEGIGWYSDAADQITVFRLFNPYASIGTHHYTKDGNEYNTLPGYGWRQENIAWYATNGPTLTIQGFWLVSDSWSSGTLQRYWIDATGAIATSRLVTPEEGAGYYAYAKSDGAVVRGKYNTGEGHVLVAWDNGEIYQDEGWVVTGAFDGGLQRYWFEMTSLGVAGAKAGYFIIDGSYYFGRGDTGYVVHDKYDIGSHVLLADGDGRLSTHAAGWLVTDSYDGGMQRYWLENVFESVTAALVGKFDMDGASYYGMPGEGYVARNRYVNAGDGWYHADDDGRLSTSYDPQTIDMIIRAQGFSSPTGRLVMVDTGACRVGIFSGSQNNWNLDRFEPCVCGAPGSPTITGTYSTGYHLDSLPAWSNALYCTNIVGGYFFHSILNSTSELGNHLSHGCVRLDWPFAQYVQGLPYGSTVNLY